MSAATDGIPDELARYLARCGRGEYWLAHEELEPLWLRERDDFFKGLIHLAAGLLHDERGNSRGATTKLTSARRHLQVVPDGLGGLRHAELLADVDRWLERIGAGRSLPSIDLSAYFPAAMRAETVPDVRLPYRVRRYERGYRPWRKPDVSGSADDD